MKIVELLQARKVLTEHSSVPLPSVLAYKIMKVLKGTDDDQTFFEEKYRDIIEKYAKRSDDGKIENNGGAITIVPDKIDECQKAITDLNNTDVVLSNIKFSLAELAPLNFTVEEIYALDCFITEE